MQFSPVFALVLHVGPLLNFLFSPNEYFTNSVLTKEYELRNDYDKDDPLDYDGPEVVKAKGCQIDWKPGKNPGIKIITKKIKVGTILCTE